MSNVQQTSHVPDQDKEEPQEIGQKPEETNQDPEKPIEEPEEKVLEQPPTDTEIIVVETQQQSTPQPENHVTQTHTEEENSEHSAKISDDDQHETNQPTPNDEPSVPVPVDEVLNEMSLASSKNDQEPEPQKHSDLPIVLKENLDIENTPKELNGISNSAVITASGTSRTTLTATDGDGVVIDNIQVEIQEVKESCCDKTLQKSGVIIIICVMLVAFALVGIAIGTNKDYDTSIGTLIGFIIANVVISCVACVTIGLFFIKTWRQKSGQIVFWVIYLGNIINTFAIAVNVGGLFQILLIIYGITKVFLIPHANVTAKVDGKKLVPSLIEHHITISNFKKTKLFFCYLLLVAGIFIQVILISLASLAIVGGFNWLKFFALIFIVAMANIPRHFMAYFMANVISHKYSDDGTEVELPEDVLKQSFNICKSKLSSIVLLSFFICTSPIWISIANIMYTLEIVSGCLGLYGHQIAEHEEEKDREGGCCWCCGCLCRCLGGIIFGISWVLEKISKSVLQYTAKILIVNAGFLGTSIIDVHKITKNNILKQHKKIFAGGSKRMFLDDAMNQHITHLCILLSSIFVWGIIGQGTGTVVIVWIGGYAAARCMLEPIDTVIKAYLNAWYIKPQIIYLSDLLSTEFEARFKSLQAAFGDKQVQATDVQVTQTETRTMSRLENSNAGDVVITNSNTRNYSTASLTTKPNQQVNGLAVQQTDVTMSGQIHYPNQTINGNMGMIQSQQMYATPVQYYDNTPQFSNYTQQNQPIGNNIVQMPQQIQYPQQHMQYQQQPQIQYIQQQQQQQQV